MIVNSSKKMEVSGQEAVGRNSKKILIVKLSSIGDCLMATPVAKALRTAFPDGYIAWVVERKSADVILGNPYLDEVIVWDRPKGGTPLGAAGRFWGSLIELRKRLHAHNFDMCLDFQGLLRSGIVSRLSGADVIAGFSDAGEGSTLFYTHKYKSGKSDLNAQQRNLDLLKVIGVESTDTTMYMPLSDEDRLFAESFFTQNDLNDKKVVGLCPATTWVNKHWIPEGWSKVADILGERYGATPLIFGSSANIPLATTISDNAKHKPVICAGKTTLKQAGALLEKCVAVIGVDTGLLHMAVALGRPSVGLFGASAWRCFQKNEKFAWVAKDFPCSPCRRHPTCDNIDCMAAITPEDVEDAVKRWLV